MSPIPRPGPPELPDPSSEAWSETWTLIHLVLHRTQRNARALGMTLPQCWALRRLSLDGPMTPGRLAEELRVQMPAVTSLVTHLEQRRWVRRAHAADDRRRVHISLAPAGSRALARFQRAQARLRVDMFRGIRERRLRELAALLRVASRNLIPRASSEALSLEPS